MALILAPHTSLLYDRLLRPVLGRYSLILWKTGRSGTQPVLLIVTLLIAQALATAYGLPWLQQTSQPTDRCRIVGLHARYFFEKCHFLASTTPVDIKPNRSPAHGRHASVCKISPPYDATFRRR